jgi:hypothetical protein
MKANELMIGDWVIDDKNIAQITSITCDGIIETTFNESSNIEVIEPIPLTQEILEKNGFEKRWQGNYEFFDDDENLNIDFFPKSTNYTNGAYDYIDIEKGCLTINEMPITFVHELQHVLILCESKKEIIL